jgi:3-hexulose-6-phosphate synthase/6-phospho-3-hexuloisomerase
LPTLTIAPPVVQVAIDVLNRDDALRIAEAAVRAGVDWLEAGTPLLTFCGTPILSALSEAFPGVPVLADYKTMDGGRKYVLETRDRGARLATVCAQAADETVTASVEAGREAEIAVVCDLINAADVAGRAAEVEALGVDSVFVHWGADQRARQPERDAQRDLRAVVERVRIPVGVATFSVEDGVRAVRQGAGIAVIGFPLIGEAGVEEALRRYVGEVKAV